MNEKTGICQNFQNVDIYLTFGRVSAVFDRLKNKSDNAMISIYPFGDEYFAMTETPVVHRIDPEDLSTKER